jgi:hypothetical protein
LYEKERADAPALDNDKLTEQEALDLHPGELVEVKGIDEILSTFDEPRRHQGLLWMTGMRKFCGKRYKVKKRVGRIILESSGELRKVNNTVLLENVTCDGKHFGNCDRCCYHLWREVWLRRVKKDQSPNKSDAERDRA